MNISECINWIVNEYSDYYPERKTPSICINSVQWSPNGDGWLVDTGICQQVSALLRDLYPGGRFRFIYNLETELVSPVHCVYEYEGRCYDCFTPGGLGDLAKHPWFLIYPKHSVADRNTERDRTTEQQYTHITDGPFVCYCRDILLPVQ